MIRTLKKKRVWLPALFILLVWANNRSWLAPARSRQPELLAHRGLAQTFELQGVKWDTNTARIIHPPEHPYLENTLASMRAAFDLGADLVEFDLRLTRDKKLAVFHDYALENRTDGRGLVSEHTMEELKRLDVGYGYTADNGQTYPFRGKARGQMPILDEVLDAFTDRALLIHIKDGGEEAGRLLIAYLEKTSPAWREKIAVYGDSAAIRILRDRFPSMKVLTKNRIITAFWQYALLGWTGYIPPSIRNMELHLPIRYARLFWGWPDRFLERMRSVNTRVVLVRGNSEWSSGFDHPADLDLLPKHYSGCIWTDRIDVIAPHYRRPMTRPAVKSGTRDFPH